MAIQEWFIVTTLPLVLADGAGHALAPGAAAPAMAGSAVALTARAWTGADFTAPEEAEPASEGEMPPGTTPDQAVIYQSETGPDAAAALPPPPALTMGRGEKKNATLLDDLTLPTPAELFLAIGKGRRVSWAGYYRPPGAMGYRNRPQVAMNLGFVLADAYLALEARDTMYSQSMTQELLTLASALGMSHSQLARGQSLLRFASEAEWPVLRSELEAMENEIKTALLQQRDSALVDVLSLGRWLRTLQIVSSSLRADDYTTERAAVMRQPELYFWLNDRANALPPRVAEEKVVNRMKDCLVEMQPYLAFDARRPPTQLEYDKMNRLLGRFMKSAVTR
jgi:hypothetical protein